MQAVLQPVRHRVTGNRTVGPVNQTWPRSPLRPCLRAKRQYAIRECCTHRPNRQKVQLLTVVAASGDSQHSGLDTSRRARLQRQGQASLHLVQQSWKLLKAHIWPIILIFILCDIANFGINRVCHRLTNEVVMQVLSISPADLGNLWFLGPNPGVATFASRYNILVQLAYVPAFPLTILARTVATSAIALLCCRHPGTHEESSMLASSTTNPAEAADTPQASSSAVTQDTAVTPARKGIRATIGHMVSTVRLLQPGVAAVWKRVFVVDLLVAMQALPLQVASLVLVSLPWTLPRLLDLQAANPIAVLDGQEGWQAIAKSKQVIQPLRAALALPFLGLLVVTRLLEPLKGHVLVALPVRYYRELPEIPIAIYVGLTILSVILNRMHNLLPVVLYQQGQRHDSQPVPSSP